MKLLIFGATGPVDAHKRRPWIDWVHTSRDQGALVRAFVKWDDQPHTIDAVPESFARAFKEVHGQTPGEFRRTPQWASAARGLQG